MTTETGLADDELIDHLRREEVRKAATVVQLLRIIDALAEEGLRNAARLIDAEDRIASQENALANAMLEVEKRGDRIVELCNLIPAELTEEANHMTPEWLKRRGLTTEPKPNLWPFGRYDGTGSTSHAGPHR